MSDSKGQIGSSFEDFLAEQGTLEETTAVAVKRVLAWQLKQAMEERHMSKNQMAKAMRTSRTQLDRILDPDNDHVQLNSLMRRARAGSPIANRSGLNPNVAEFRFPQAKAPQEERV